MSDSVGISEITLPHSGWETNMIDYDNDGWRDIFVAQGHVMDNIELTDPSLRYLEPLLLMKNNAGKFRNASQESGPALRAPLSARGAAFGDLDNDGCIEIAIDCTTGRQLFFEIKEELLITGCSSILSARLAIAMDSGLEST